ncbi:MAG: phenylacetate--CoA ligase family protein [Saprospiraceae bacterium]|nr:phenylacetate--CoA ligase family protein [Saprospiraceae bacterium]MCB9322275.1 phenylacetate--CoA ligase family protein [Lewinellaceae bacterium]
MNTPMILLKTLDKAKGLKVYPWYRFFQNTLSWQRDQVEVYQAERLQKLIEYALNTVPYYRAEWNRLGIRPHDIKTPSDLKKCSILDRDTLRNKQEELISSYFPLKNMHKGSSSGTTGIPINYYTDTDGLSAGMAAGYALWNMSGWNPGQSNVHIWGNQTSIKRWNTIPSKLKNLLFHQKNIASTLLNDPEQIPELAERIVRFNPRSIDGYSSSIYDFARYCQEEKIHLKNLKQVLTTAENLEPYQQKLIEQILAPTGDLYGSGEVLGMAARPVNDDRYYVLDPHVILETEASEISGMKNLLITDLNNYGMPMIRYRIGDMVDELHEPEPQAKFPFAWFKKIQGRSSDIITLPNGKKIHPVNIFGGTLFRRFPQITRHKVVWNGTFLEFIFEAKEKPDAKELHRQLSVLLHPFEVPFSIEYKDRILPSSNGKYKYLEIIPKKTVTP